MLVLLVPIIGATAVTIHVPGDYSTIQGGLGGAQTGDTVLVAPGTYFENLYWPDTQAIKLLSEQGSDLTIIDGGNTGIVIRFHWLVDNTTIIDGFTIQHGVTIPNPEYGAGICLENEASPTIRNNTIQDCKIIEEGWGGAGIGTTGGPTSVRIEGNIIQNNTASPECANNSAYGIGIYISYGNNVQIVDNLIIGNGPDSITCISYGGGLYISNGSASITNNEIIENTAIWGAGMALGFGSPWKSGKGYFEVIANNISSNIGDGAAISTMSIFNINSCTISNNTGNGIEVSGFAAVHVPQIHYCNIFGNEEYGIYAHQDRWTDATYCWWGVSNGPGGVGPGSGDEVSEYVQYNPWLAEMGVETADSGSRMELCVFPNPFSSNAAVSFDLPNTGLVAIRVFDLSGRIVDESVESLLQAGNQTIQLNGSEWSPGVYLIHLNTASSTVTQRCVLVR